MAPKATLSLLFHPKKGTKKENQANAPSPRKAIPATPRPNLPQEQDEDGLKLPDGPFQEFKLMSSALNGWKYDVMKFDSRKPIDISRWTPPIKLNRKELRRDDGVTTDAPQAVGPMLGPDGKPVIGADGKMVMIDAEGRPIQNVDSNGGGGGKGKGPAVNGKKRFQKKTRQVFYVPEEVRQLRREERYPWVMEDSSLTQSELWIGQMEDVAKSETHGFFMPAANDVFKFVPAHRWYKFQKKLKHDLPTDTANVESLYTLNQKRDPQAWLSSRNGKGPSAATAAMFKADAEGRTVAGESSLVHTSSQSLGPGGRKLKTVDSGPGGLFDEEDGESRRRREKEYGAEGDLDEQVYEEDFADDEEHMDVEENKDEEAKEIEERLKREYKTANKQREGGVDESDEEEVPGISKQAKAMQKLIRNREGNDAYESDEEENPYASSVEEEEEEDTVITGEPAIQQQPQQVKSRSSSLTPQSQAPQSQAPQSQAPQTGPPRAPTSPVVGSRATSPSASPSLGGHSVVAKRATSPKAPKLKTNNMSRGNSPLGSRATSPIGNARATSPPGVSGNSRLESPTAHKSNNKRKADEIASTAPLTPKLKKRKAQAPGAAPIAVSAEELRRLLIEWLGNTGNAATRDCIHHFTPYLTDGEKKTEFSALVREVAQLKNGVLVLRKKFQEGGSAAPSPAPNSGI